jgi:hypothetical protein
MIYNERDTFHQLKDREAKYWSLRKWRALKYKTKIPEEINKYRGGCPYCEVFIGDANDRCDGCPINIFKINMGRGKEFFNGCSRTTKHPFMKWRRNPCKKTAQGMIDLIKNIKVDDTPRYFSREANIENNDELEENKEVWRT